MIKRNTKFQPEMPKLTKSGVIRLGVFAAVVSLSTVGIVSAGATGYKWLTSENTKEVIRLDADKIGWRREPDVSGGRRFHNKGLNINLVQAELFDKIDPEEIKLAPPPDDF
jgi:hypothetical protein